MHLDKRFEVRASPEDCRSVLAEDQLLIELFPDADNEIIAREGPRKTVRSRYRALGQEGEATFHFDPAPDGGVHFEKVCDGRVWKRLEGRVRLEPTGVGTRVVLELDGATKGFVPEFTIRSPMNDQLEQMARALHQRMEALG